jgi:serine/threonine kinase 32
MAPEVLKRSGYREEADWWSLAVLAFELLFGKRPFRAPSGKEVMYKIVHAQFRFPSNSVREISEECLDFISRCLERDKSKRLGCEGGASQLKAHPWFRRVDWRLCESRALSPPFTPNLKTGNFSAIHEAEDCLLEEKPLKPNRRKSVMVSSDPEMALIQDEFRDYDFEWFIGDEERKERLRLVAEHSQKMEKESSAETVGDSTGECKDDGEVFEEEEDDDDEDISDNIRE